MVSRIGFYLALFATIVAHVTAQEIPPLFDNYMDDSVVAATVVGVPVQTIIGNTGNHIGQERVLSGRLDFSTDAPNLRVICQIARAQPPVLLFATFSISVDVTSQGDCMTEYRGVGGGPITPPLNFREIAGCDCWLVQILRSDEDYDLVIEVDTQSGTFAGARYESRTDFTRPGITVCIPFDGPIAAYDAVERVRVRFASMAPAVDAEINFICWASRTTCWHEILPNQPTYFAGDVVQARITCENYLSEPARNEPINIFWIWPAGTSLQAGSQACNIPASTGPIIAGNAFTVGTTLTEGQSISCTFNVQLQQAGVFPNIQADIQNVASGQVSNSGVGGNRFGTTEFCERPTPSTLVVQLPPTTLPPTTRPPTTRPPTTRPPTTRPPTTRPPTTRPPTTRPPTTRPPTTRAPTTAPPTTVAPTSPPTSATTLLPSSIRTPTTFITPATRVTPSSIMMPATAPPTNQPAISTLFSPSTVTTPATKLTPATVFTPSTLAVPGSMVGPSTITAPSTVLQPSVVAPATTTVTVPGTVQTPSTIPVPQTMMTPSTVMTPSSIRTPATITTPTSIFSPGTVMIPSAMQMPATVMTPSSIRTPATITTPSTIFSPASLTTPTTVDTPATMRVPGTIQVPGSVLTPSTVITPGVGDDCPYFNCSLQSGTWRLRNHPDAIMAPPQYCLRLDSLIPNSPQLPVTFDCDTGIMELSYDSVFRRLRIQGRIFGGTDVGVAHSTVLPIDISITYTNVIKDDVLNRFITTDPAMGMLNYGDGLITRLIFGKSDGDGTLIVQLGFGSTPDQFVVRGWMDVIGGPSGPDLPNDWQGLVGECIRNTYDP